MNEPAQSDLPRGDSILGTALWREACELPNTVADSLQRAEGHAELATLLSRPGTERIVVTGNGASWYAATAMWLAALTAAGAPEVVCVPAGLLAGDGFRWRSGDVLVAFSSSGSLRDLVDAVEGSSVPSPFGLVTAEADSPLGRLAGACAMVTVASQQAVTHTQAYLGAVVVGLEILARLTDDERLRRALRQLPEVLRDQAVDAPARAGAQLDAAAGPFSSALSFGTGCAWPAAMETALLLKEVAGIPAEGAETREGATSGMYALAPGQLVVGLPVGSDLLAAEAASVCAGRGATVQMLAWPTEADPRVATAAHFMGPLALSIGLARRGGLNPDQPGWYDAYLATARREASPVDSIQPESPGSGPTTTEES